MTESSIEPWSRAAIEQNGRWLMAFLLGATGDRNAADDLVQEVFQIAYEKRREFASGTNFGGWLRAIARNCLSRYFERSRRSPILVGEAMSRLEESAAQWEGRMLDPGWLEARLAALRDCMRRLPERARDILRRRYGEKKPSQEVAALLGTTAAAIDVAVFRARAQLAECVEKKLAYDS